MKNSHILICLLIFLSVMVSCTQKTTPRNSSATKTNYRTGIDDSTLFGVKSPFIMPYNRIIHAAGESVSFGDADVENHSLDAVMLPDQKTLVVEDRFGLAFFDTQSRKLMSRWSYSKDSKYSTSMSSFSGIKSIYHNDSTFIFWGAGGRKKPNSYVMQAFWDGMKANFIQAIPFDEIAPATIALPNEVSLIVEGGELFLYVVLNGNNQLAKIKVHGKQTLWTVPTGMAPFGLTVVKNKAFITNWAGPVPDGRQRSETAGIPWGSAYIDPKTGAMSQGTVSVIDTGDGKLIKEIHVGLHPNAIISSPDKRHVYVANGNSDYISVIDAQADKVIDSIFVGLFNNSNGYIGSTPNALAINEAGTILYVANGLDNAICVVELGTPASTYEKRKVKIKGYIPKEAYPSASIRRASAFRI